MPKFPSIEWFNTIRDLVNADDAFRQLGNVDAQVGIKVGDELLAVDFEAFECIGARKIEESDLRDVDFWLEQSPEEWKEMLLGMPEGELEPPGDGEMYVHEIPGADVVVDGSVVGTARELIETPGGSLLAVDVDGREVLVPFREPSLKLVDRKGRRIVLDPPPGLLEF